MVWLAIDYSNASPLCHRCFLVLNNKLRITFWIKYLISLLKKYHQGIFLKLSFKWDQNCPVWTYFQNICYHVFQFRTIFDEFGRKPVNKSSLKIKTMLSNRMKVQKEKDQSNNENWFQVGNWLFNSYYRVQNPNLENQKAWYIISISKLGCLTLYSISYMAFNIFFFITAHYRMRMIMVMHLSSL